MAQRRSLFEVLGIFTYVMAVILSVFSILNWTSQPYFVAGCTAIWILFSVSVVTRIWWGDQKERVLEIPDTWDEPVGKSQAAERFVLERHAAPGKLATIAAVNPASAHALPDTGNLAAANSDSSTAEPVYTPAQVIDIQAAATNQTGLRTVRLQQYRQERLLRYRQKRSSGRAVASNLAIYRTQSANVK